MSKVYSLSKAREYEEKYSVFIEDEKRPALHLSPRIGWMNDPNGFIYYGGQYHLFYQYHPYSTKWGPMHWGHAVSKDLLHWEYLPAALAPDESYDDGGCFSGSAMTLPDGQLLLLYTANHSIRKKDGRESARQTQCVAIGDGINFRKYDGNPVLDKKDVPEGFSHADFRDPRIFQNDDGSYSCVVGNRTDDDSGAILLYESPDCLNWHFVTILDRSYNEYGRMWECPDFFTLDGRQVLLTSPQDMNSIGKEFHNGNGTVCLIGSYDPEKHIFSRENIHSVDYGIDFYASQTLLTEDGRRIMIGWMQNWDSAIAYPPETKWFGQMSLPRELHLRNDRLLQQPIRELLSCRGRRISYENVTVQEEITLPGIYGRVIDMTICVRPQNPGALELFRMKFARGSQHYSSISFNPKNGSFRISRIHSGFCRDLVHERTCIVPNSAEELVFRIILDRFSVEIFLNDGEQVLSMTYYTPLSADGISFEAQGSALLSVEKYDLIL